MIVIYRVGKQIVGGQGGVLGDVLIIFHCDGDVKSIAGLKVETGLTVEPWVLLDECLLCVVHWTILL